ncbi:MAG: hypothetical protein K8T90_19500 [Planctomycetes bacterium]|nr:hypothetical protein [Planctomycetota bacterium]
MSPIHHGRRIGSAAALVLVAALGAGCTDGQAQEKGPGRTPDAPRPLPPVATESVKPSEQAPAQQQPAPKPSAAAEPHGSRPIDDGAIRALAEEVARLRAELVKLRERNPEGDAAAGSAPTEPTASAPEPAPQPAAAAEPRRREPEAEATAPQPEPEPSVERVVERVVEREVPVYIEGPVVERVIEVEVAPQIVFETGPTVYVERVVYRDTSCEQTISFGHVHHIGCGHHYYGCSCHPWYYDLDGGFGIQFIHIDHDDHDHDGGHGRPPRGTYARGYNNGFEAGFNAGDGRDQAPPPRPIGRGPGAGRPEAWRERAPSEPVRRLDGRESGRPDASRIENGGVERPSGHHQGAGPLAPPASRQDDRTDERQDDRTNAPGNIGADSRAPREPARRAPAAAGGGEWGDGRTPPTADRPGTRLGDGARDRAGSSDGAAPEPRPRTLRPSADPQPRHVRPDAEPPRLSERERPPVAEPVVPVRQEPERARPQPRPERDDAPAREPRRVAPENRGERRVDTEPQRPRVERRDPPVLRQPETPRAPAPRRPDAPERRPKHQKGEEEGS